MSGRLHIELCRVAGSLPERNLEIDANDSFDDDEPGSGVAKGTNIVCRVGCITYLACHGVHCI